MYTIIIESGDTNMTKEEIRKAAYDVLACKHRGINEAMQRVLGEFDESKLELFCSVYAEIENIRYPHGKGEDATNCE